MRGKSYVATKRSHVTRIRVHCRHLYDLPVPHLRITFGIVEHDSSEVVKAEAHVHGGFGHQVILVPAMLVVQFVQHSLVCALLPR